MVRELKQRGYRLAVIKHSHHDFDIDQPGKDSWRLSQAGSDVVAVSSPNKMALIEHVDKEITLDQLTKLFTNKIDIWITEGYKESHTPKILILDMEGSKPNICHTEEIVATVSADSSYHGVPQFANEDVKKVIDLLIKHIRKDLSGSSEDVIYPADSKPTGTLSQQDRFEKLLTETAAVHGHICPGQVLGVRMAMRGCQELGIDNPKEENKRLITYVEIDRCATDAIQVVTGCKLGKRTMKYIDYGKLAATFLDLHTGNAVRLAVREDIREKALHWHRPEWTKHEAEAAAYKVMSDEELFQIESVFIEIPPEDMPGPPISRVICDKCGEAVNDYREVLVAGKAFCRACAGEAYYQRQDSIIKEYATFS